MSIRVIFPGIYFLDYLCMIARRSQRRSDVLDAKREGMTFSG